MARQDEPSGTAALAAVVLPLVTQVDALRQTAVTQAETILDHAATIGRQGIELEAEWSKPTPCRFGPRRGRPVSPAVRHRPTLALAAGAALTFGTV